MEPQPVTTGAGVAPAAGGRTLNLKRSLDFVVVGALVVLFVTLSLTSDAFLTQQNLLNVVEQWAPVGLMALGGTVVIIAGGFDLSVGGIFVVAGVAAASIANATSAEIGILAGLVVGLGLGTINGLLTTVGRMNPFVATIGTLIVYSGLGVAITGGFVITVTDGGFGWIGRSEALGVKLSIWILLIGIVLISFLLGRTTYGRRLRAVGGNLQAARLSGLRTNVITTAAYAISGLTAGLAAVLVASRSASATSSTANVAFDVWTAILVGGNSLVGGEGAVWRTVVGVFLLALIHNGFNLLALDPSYKQMVTGVILLTAVGLDAAFRMRRS